MSESAPVNNGSGPERQPAARESGATPDAVVSDAENDTTPSELDLTATPTRPAPQAMRANGSDRSSAQLAEPARGADSGRASGEPEGLFRDNTPEPARREPMVLEALLLQIPGVDALAVFKLTAAGLARFGPLLRCTPADLARQAGLPLATAEVILTELAGWKGGLNAPAGGEPQAAAWRSFEPLLAELTQHNANLERATSGWSKDQVSARRRLRQDRDRVYMSIKASLASIGELDLLMRMEKLSFAKRIDELHRLLRAGAAAGVLTSGRKGPTGDPPNGRTHT